MSENRKYQSKRYLLVWVQVTVTLLALGSALNIYMDPLMFRTFGHGYPKQFMFNERISKIAHYRGQAEKIECLVLGSSRTTFFDTRALTGWNCANYSFSGAKAEEILVYLKYLKMMGLAPKKIIIGIDDFAPNDLQGGKLDSVPLFVLNREAIGNPLKYYISVDTFIFSVQTLLDNTYSPNYYDQNLHKYIGFPLRRVVNQYEDDFYVSKDGGSGALKYYREFAGVFPDARWIGYIPPISQWARLKLGTPLVRKNYVKMLATFEQIFDELYDFTFLTRDCDEYEHTYDGIHYSGAIYEKVATAIIEGIPQYLLSDTNTSRGVKTLERRYINETQHLASPTCTPDGV